jgi:hypothetical protein
LAYDATSLALSPTVEVWLEVAVLDDVFEPLVDCWLQDQELSLQGFAIAYPLTPRANAAAVAIRVFRMRASCWLVANGQVRLHSNSLLHK